MFMQVECFTELEEGDEPEMSLLIQILAVAQLFFAQLFSMPPQRQPHTRHIIGEMGAVEMVPFPSCTPSAGSCFACDLCSVAVRGLSIQPQGKECASSWEDCCFLGKGGGGMLFVVCKDSFYCF